jgi:predicted anti-sigma-YlaC factor YlaD
MNCEKIKELILTDYIDNEMSDEVRIRLNIHFANCHKCKEFLETVKNTVVSPFTNVKKVEPSGFLWYRLKEAIIAQQRKKPGLVTGILERLRPVFYIPKPALVMSTVMVLVFVVVLTNTLRLSDKEKLESSRETQAEYSVYSIETPVSALLNNDNGFGTLVEKYFL